MTRGKQIVYLCMIVKDEAAVIERCLASVRSIVDGYLIVDTGSTDDTADRISRALHGLPGDVFGRPWVDFATNRTQAIEIARETEADYLLIIDADDILAYAPDYVIPALEHSAYSFDIHYNGIVYNRPHLISTDIPWRYTGVVHEYLEIPDGVTVGSLPIQMVIEGGGNRSADPEKYQKDAALLEKALGGELSDFLRSRYTFYLAQSYRDCGEKALACETYLARSLMGFWDQERYVSLLEAGKLMAACGYGTNRIIENYRVAGSLVPERAEAAYEISKLCRAEGRHAEGYGVVSQYVGKPCPSGLFVEPWLYGWVMYDELAVHAYWIARYKESLKASITAMQTGAVPASEAQRILHNMSEALGAM